MKASSKNSLASLEAAFFLSSYETLIHIYQLHKRESSF